MSVFTKLWLYLEGKKTYLVGAAFAVVNVLINFNVITISNKTILVVNGILTALGLTALRLAIRGVE